MPDDERNEFPQEVIKSVLGIDENQLLNDFGVRQAADIVPAAIDSVPVETLKLKRDETKKKLEYLGFELVGLKSGNLRLKKDGAQITLGMKENGDFGVELPKEVKKTTGNRALDLVESFKANGFNAFIMFEDRPIAGERANNAVDQLAIGIKEKPFKLFVGDYYLVLVFREDYENKTFIPDHWVVLPKNKLVEKKSEDMPVHDGKVYYGKN